MFLMLFEAYLFQINYAQYFSQRLAGSHPPVDVIPVLGTLAISFLSIILAVIFVGASLKAGCGLRWLYFGLFGFALFFEYGYRTVFARSSTGQDIIIALNPLDTEIGRDAILAYGNGFVIIPLAIYGLLLVATNRGGPPSLPNWERHIYQLKQSKFPVATRPPSIPPARVLAKARGEVSSSPSQGKVGRGSNVANIQPQSLKLTHMGQGDEGHSHPKQGSKQTPTQALDSFFINSNTIGTSCLKSLRTLAIVLFGIFVFFSGLYPLSNGDFPTVGLSAFFRTITFAAWELATDYHGPRTPLDLQVHSQPANNIIFIVDESVRGDHLSLNGYRRPTTPYLDKLSEQGLIYNWGVGQAAGACSLISNNLLLSGINRLPTDEALIKKKPTIFQYAQAMGYKTYHLNATSNQFWLGTADDLNYVDEWWPRDRFETEPRFDIDFTLAKQTSQLIHRSVGNFIWINKRGLHFNYNSHYPPTAAHWQPVLATRFKPDARLEMVNSYDNAIRYNVNTFFYHLLETNPTILAQTTIIYTSDHGQTLSEHGETWTHCAGTENEFLVPIFMISAHPYRINTHSEATHFNIFATLLDLMAFPESERQYPYAPSLVTIRK